MLDYKQPPFLLEIWPLISFSLSFSILFLPKWKNILFHQKRENDKRKKYIYIFFFCIKEGRKKRNFWSWSLAFINFFFVSKNSGEFFFVFFLFLFAHIIFSLPFNDSTLWLFGEFWYLIIISHFTNQFFFSFLLL